MINSRTNHKGEVKTGKKPSRKRMRLQGKTVYDKYNNNVGQTVWTRITKKEDGRRIIIYELKKCDKKDCGGILKIDIRGYKCCVNCGLSTKYDNGIQNDYHKIKSTDYHLHSGRSDETLENRNEFWDSLHMEQLIYYKDNGADKLTERYNNVREWELNHKNEKAIDQKEVDNFDLLHSKVRELLPDNSNEMKI